MPVTEWIPWAVRLRYQKSQCERYGTLGPRLGLHHKDENRLNNSPENLLTLCLKCHTLTHWENGKRAWRRRDPFCLVCDKRSRHLGLCPTHRSRLRRHGSPFLMRKRIGQSWQFVEEFGVKNGQECREWPRTLKSVSTASADSVMQSFPLRLGKRSKG